MSLINDLYEEMGTAKLAEHTRKCDLAEARVKGSAFLAGRALMERPMKELEEVFEVKERSSEDQQDHPENCCGRNCKNHASRIVSYKGKYRKLPGNARFCCEEERCLREAMVLAVTPHREGSF